jgi:uncharacterized protein involved in oxidation of intracellular sulfur
MRLLLILNEAPYGNERTYNGLRLAMTTQREHAEAQVRVFLMADSVTAALPGQATPDGYYSIERMLRAVLDKGGEVRMCSSCANARGLRDVTLVEGVEWGTMAMLSQWVLEADRVVTF